MVYLVLDIAWFICSVQKYHTEMRGVVCGNEYLILDTVLGKHFIFFTWLDPQDLRLSFMNTCTLALLYNMAPSVVDFSQISFVCLIAWFAWAGLIRLGGSLHLPERIVQARKVCLIFLIRINHDRKVCLQCLSMIDQARNVCLIFLNRNNETGKLCLICLSGIDQARKVRLFCLSRIYLTNQADLSQPEKSCSGKSGTPRSLTNPV